MNDLKGIIEDCNKSDLVSDKIIKKIIEIIGQEEWQDLHDENSDICTTMGELIITLNRIAELEEAKANLEYLLEGKNNEIDELKKENKVLAQNLEDTEILNNTYEKRFDNLKKENTEAKNLIEELASSLSVVGECGEEECELINKAQKFINKPIF